MLLALAMMAQDVPLNAEAEQAVTCAVAVPVIHAGEADPSLLSITAHFSYYIMVAAKADPGDGPYVDRVNALTDVARRRPQPSQAQAKAQIAECDRRYPLARIDTAAKLPADPYVRDLTCFGSVMVMYGAGLGIERMGHGDTELKRIKPGFDYFSDRAGKVISERGIAGRFAAEVDGAMLASLTIGNTYAITDACIAQMPKS
jgi:hypothetical protein